MKLAETLSKEIDAFMSEETSSKVIADIAGLSSGTLSGLTGIRSSSDVEFIQQSFVKWVKNNSKNFYTWQDAWKDMMTHYKLSSDSQGKVDGEKLISAIELFGESFSEDFKNGDRVKSMEGDTGVVQDSRPCRYPLASKGSVNDILVKTDKGQSLWIPDKRLQLESFSEGEEKEATYSKKFSQLTYFTDPSSEKSVSCESPEKAKSIIKMMNDKGGFQQTLKIGEANGKIVELTNDGYTYEVKFIDSTHIEMKMKDSSSGPAVYQSYQAPEWVMAQLKAKGLISGNKFFVVEAEDLAIKGAQIASDLQVAINHYKHDYQTMGSGQAKQQRQKALDLLAKLKSLNSEIVAPFGKYKMITHMPINKNDIVREFEKSFLQYEESFKSEAVDKKEIQSVIVALNAGGGDFKYPIGNKELNARTKSLETSGYIEYDKVSSKWKATNKKPSEAAPVESGLKDYCKNLEKDYSTKEILDFLRDGGALSKEGFSNQGEVEDVYALYRKKG